MSDQYNEEPQMNGDEVDQQAAASLDAISRAALASGASNVTQGVDYLTMAQRSAMLSQIVSSAGVEDVAQGAELLMASDDIAVMGAIVSAMSDEDLEEGMELASISGELAVVSDVMAALGMPVVAAFLEDRGQRLRDIAVDNVLRFGATRALSEAMVETGEDVAALGSNEVEEGLTRIEVAGEIADESQALAAAGDQRVMEGLAELETAKAARLASREEE